MKKHLNLLREFSIPLVAGVVVALVWANLGPADSSPLAQFEHEWKVVVDFGLFVSGSALADPMIQGAAKMGAMFSLVAALLGVLLGRIVRIRKVR